jgi:hypothetical protein
MAYRHMNVEIGATAAFWRTFHHDGRWKNKSRMVGAGDAGPPPFSIVTITYKVAVYAPAEWADTLNLFHLYQYVCTLWAHYMHRRQSEGTVHSTSTAGRRDLRVGSRRQEAEPGDRTF